MTTPHRFVERGPCPLCGGTRFASVHEFPSIPVRRCVQCSFMHSSRIMPSEVMAQYYGEDFGSDRHRLGQRLVAGINHRAVGRLLDLRHTRSLLDVGTGFGFFPALMRDREGLRVAAVELSEREARHASRTLGVEVHNGPLAEAPFARESFDLVSSFEVIEHVPDPVSFVRELAECARPGGHVLVGTDNFGAWVVGRLGPTYPMWIPHTHISHFTPETLRRCIEQVEGLTVVREYSYTPWEHFVRVALQRGRRPPPASEAYDLEQALATEFARHDYPFARARRLMRHAWFSIAAREHPRGAVMWMLARKAVSPPASC
jgi:2-polyprenyl-3-methyl-5-hydroxy-6-metoxy-1,4-benzoquinol methylase